MSEKEKSNIETQNIKCKLIKANTCLPTFPVCFIFTDNRSVKLSYETQSHCNLVKRKID